MSAELTFNLTIILGALIVVPIARLRFGTWLTSGMLYSFGWLAVVVFYHYLDLVVPEGYEIPVSSFEFGTKLVLWGYVGVLFAHLCFGAPKLRYREFYNYFSDIGIFLDKYYIWICGFVFFFGSLALFDRLSAVGFSIFSLADLRNDHMHSAFSGFQRFGVYGGIFLGLLIILCAVDDNIKERVNLRRIAAIIIAMLPLALSKGSRQEFMTPVITYGVTTFLVFQLRLISGQKIKWNLLWRMYAKFFPFFVALLFFFNRQ